MTYLLGAIAALIAALLMGRWMATAQPAVVARSIRYGLITFVSIATLFVIWAGRYQLVAMILPFLLPAFLRWRSINRWQRNARGPTPGQTSAIKTGFLNMALDHDSGALDGEVIAGRFAGRRLGDMALDDLLRLYGECRADEPSSRILEAYLDRVHGAAWRTAAEEGQGTNPRPSGAGGPMTRDDAYAILGLKAGADAQAIKDAHRRLMAGLHPDRGGSDYLAALINRARDVLLGR